MSESYLRQSKDAFIVTVTLVSRAAIEAGMAVEDVFRMSDTFIRRRENARSDDKVASLYYELIHSYTAEVYHYVMHHLSSPASTADLAGHLYLSRSHLSRIFKEETGENLIDYIHAIKIEKAKELLKDRTKSILSISDYLGYSSPSHFNRVFRSIVNMTPKEYRKEKMREILL